MLARIFTRLFYAAVFFALGVWAAPSIGGFGNLIDTGVSAATRGFDGLWSWAEQSISSTPAPIAVPVPAPKPTTVAAVPAPPAVAPAQAKPADPLEIARSAYARGDVTGAIRAYDDLIAKRPDDAALRGELGNVYWASGRLQDAARTYHATALSLIAAGRTADAAPLEAAIRKGDAGLADDLARRLAAAKTK